jgi:hypothetical protein
MVFYRLWSLAAMMVLVVSFPSFPLHPAAIAVTAAAYAIAHAGACATVVIPSVAYAAAFLPAALHAAL